LFNLNNKFEVESEEEYAIEVNNVSKRFKIPREKRTTVYENITGLFKGNRYSYEEFWALQDVSFKVKKGETLGIIGENGSGKSTLLKLIAGVLYPDTGKVRVNGKIAPFLELGVGFQPELTAEENVRLYGAVMGMTKTEMEVKFEEIFEFAELERFKEMKLKNFSSGMYMRLAFATAIATNPDILLIDEVLAVGDEAFQKKCFNTINEIKRKNKTIIFVSHDMETVKKLCKNSIYLDHGIIRYKGSTEKVIYDYYSYINEKEVKDFEKTIIEKSVSSETENPKDQWGTREIEITNVKILDKNNEENSIFTTGDIMKIQIHYKINKDFENPAFGIAIFSNDGTYITGVNTNLDDITLKLDNYGGTLTLNFENLTLLTGLYKITIAVCSGNKWNTPYDIRSQQYTFKVQSAIRYEGFVHFPHKWEV